MFYGFSGDRVISMVAIGDMDKSVCACDDRGVVAGGGILAARIVFEVLFPFPGFAFVIGQGYGEIMSSLFGIVEDHEPLATGERRHIEPGARVGKLIVF